MELWRKLFVAGGILVIVGGAMHPHGALVDMLAHPIWFGSHMISFVGIAILVFALARFRHTEELPKLTNRWVLIAIFMGAIQALEWAVHAFAYVDASNLAEGRATPVLTAHIRLAILVYTPFAISIIGLILVGKREQTIGLPNYAWIGITGSLVHSVVMVLIFGLDLMQFQNLVYFSGLIALWFVFAGIWPAKESGS